MQLSKENFQEQSLQQRHEKVLPAQQQIKDLPHLDCGILNKPINNFSIKTGYTMDNHQHHLKQSWHAKGGQKIT